MAAEYLNFGGNIIAEHNPSTGGWSDYIYADGKRVARADAPSTVTVRFTNDSCSACTGPPVGGGDRNLFVGSITIGSTVIAPNDPSIAYTNCNSYENGFRALWCPGDMTVSLAPAMVGQRITVYAYGSPDYDVYPHYAAAGERNGSG